MSSTNLPFQHFKLVENRKLIYEAEMVQYDKSFGVLTLRIINYKPTMIDEFINQKPKKEVKNIIFIDLYWPAISQDMSFYNKSYFSDILVDTMPTKKMADTYVHVKADISIQKMRFGQGYVCFDYTFRWETRKHEIKIYNAHILPEFEYIKSYFSKYFNSRHFNILMVATVTSRTTTKIIASSKQIDQISDIAIETIKFVKLSSLKKKPKFISDVSRSLFTSDDIFEPFDKNRLGTDPLTQHEILDHILSWEDIRNKKQLQFLSGHLQAPEHKIRFTLTPKFGFLFEVHGDLMVHYIWEMLNTNATYIWSFDKSGNSLDFQIKKMEEILSFIRNHGRSVYLQNDSSRDGILFRRVLHHSAQSQLVDHFPKWRHNIMETIV